MDRRAFNPARVMALVMAMVMTTAAGVAAARAAAPQQHELLVFAAASLTDVLGELAKGFEQRDGMPVKLSFAASSVLARQIEAGGRADVFISADQQWMDYLQARRLVDAATRRDLAGNRLVLIAPADSRVELRIAPGFALLAALGGGRLSIGDPDLVPAGRYARSALKSLGLWAQVEDRLVYADNVRSALMFVSRGEAPLGIVYGSDARIDPRVRIVDLFPEDTHAPITYPGAALEGARAEAIAYLNYLASQEVRQTWRRFGFVDLKQ